MSIDFLVQFIAAVITVFGVMIAIWPIQERRWKTVCGSAFIVLGIVWIVLLRLQSTAAARTSAELTTSLRRIEDLQSNLTKSQATVLEAQQELVKAQGVNNELEKQLVSLSKNTVQLSRENLATATGGNSFCVVSLIDADKPFLVAVQAGKYPLYGLTAKIIDHKLRGEVLRKYSPTIPADKMATAEMYVTLGDLNQGSGVNTVALSLEGDESRTFTIFFHARNGYWIERLRLRRVNGRWVQAIKVYKSDREPDLYTRVDKEYPTSNGGVDWNN